MKCEKRTPGFYACAPKSQCDVTLCNAFDRIAKHIGVAQDDAPINIVVRAIADRLDQLNGPIPPAPVYQSDD